MYILLLFVWSISAFRHAEGRQWKYQIIKSVPFWSRFNETRICSWIWTVGIWMWVLYLSLLKYLLRLYHQLPSGQTDNYSHHHKLQTSGLDLLDIQNEYGLIDVSGPVFLLVSTGIVITATEMCTESNVYLLVHMGADIFGVLVKLAICCKQCKKRKQRNGRMGYYTLYNI